MALKDFFRKRVESPPEERNTPAQFVNGYPVFSQFGEDVYASDIVQNCVDIIATECSKMMPRHIRTTPEGIQTTPASSINRLFKVRPNPLMTTRDFIEKTIWQLYSNFNAFIYPMYEIYDDGTGVKRKRFTGLFPLNPNRVDFEQDSKGELYVHFYFTLGGDFTLKYSEVIHLRKRFGVNDIMGGGYNGQPDNAAILTVLETDRKVIEGLGKGIEAGLAINGVVKQNTMLTDESLKKEREKFEAAIKENRSGILFMDLKGEYTSIKADPKLIDKDTMEYIESRILRYYGVSLPILSGDFNDEQYQAFYEKTLETVVISLGQAFTAAFFSDREIDFGNEIVFYQKNMMYLSTTAKLGLLKEAGSQGLLTDDQKLALLGYPPIGGEEGARRTQSLNYVDTKLVNDYQMQKAKAPQITTTGGGQGE